MKNILFPTDLSEASAKVLKFAISFARTINAEITLFHTFQPHQGPSSTILKDLSPKEHALRMLKKFARLNTEVDLWGKMKFHVRKGFSVRSIIKMSKSGDYDLILMGKGSRYDWLTRYIGSKTSYVSRMAYCPVFVVPPQAEFQNMDKVFMVGFILENGNRKLQNYLTALDFDKLEAKLSMVRFEKSNFFGNTVSLKSWPRFILGMDYPALVINPRFWDSNAVIKRTRSVAMENFIRPSKFKPMVN
ncbi:MAG: universal stress protein [Bacteroidota bacterium]